MKCWLTYFHGSSTWHMCFALQDAPHRSSVKAGKELWRERERERERKRERGRDVEIYILLKKRYLCRTLKLSCRHASAFLCSVCACVCVCARARACARVCVCAFMRTCVHVAVYPTVILINSWPESYNYYDEPRHEPFHFTKKKVRSRSGTFFVWCKNMSHFTITGCIHQGVLHRLRLIPTHTNTEKQVCLSRQIGRTSKQSRKSRAF